MTRDSCNINIGSGSGSGINVFFLLNMSTSWWIIFNTLEFYSLSIQNKIPLSPCPSGSASLIIDSPCTGSPLILSISIIILDYNTGWKPDLEFFWSAFPRIRTEYGEIRGDKFVRALWQILHSTIIFVNSVWKFTIFRFFFFFWKFSSNSGSNFCRHLIFVDIIFSDVDRLNMIGLRRVNHSSVFIQHISYFHLKIYICSIIITTKTFKVSVRSKTSWHFIFLFLNLFKMAISS